MDSLVGPGDDFVFRESGACRVYRYSAALSILQTICDMVGSGLPDVTVPSPGRSIFEALEAPSDLPSHAPFDWLAALLPPKQELLGIAGYAVNTALICHDCIDQAAFEAHLDVVCRARREGMIAKHGSFLALVHALLALGERYRITDDNTASNDDEEQSLPRG